MSLMTDDLDQAVALIKKHRYDQMPSNRRVAMWQALNQIAAELCYRLDDEKILPEDGLTALRTAAGLDTGLTGAMPISSELVITTLIQNHIDKLQEEE